MGWADEIRTLHVRTNGDTPRDATQARKFGAEGIGLCRTEHMFFEPARIKAVREMIISDTLEQRKAALAKILPMQRGDFEAIYRAMGGLPVTIRLLDPPLHEFLPHEDDEIKELADEMGVSFDKLKGKVESLHEFNPMLGTRGCRLDVLLSGDRRDADRGYRIRSYQCLEGRRPAYHAGDHGSAGIRGQRAALCKEGYQG